MRRIQYMKISGATIIALALYGVPVLAQTAPKSPECAMKTASSLMNDPAPITRVRSHILPAPSHELSVSLAQQPNSIPAPLIVSAPTPVTSPSTDGTSQIQSGTGTLSTSPQPRERFAPQITRPGGEVDLIQPAPPKPLVHAAQIEHTTQIDMKPESEKIMGKPMADKAVLADDAWALILSKYTNVAPDGLHRFDYAGLKASPKDMSALDAYIHHMGALAPSKMSPDEAMAYWANVYNALTVQVVAQNYPVTSIRKIKSGFRAGPWRRDLITVEGRTLTLDNIEHDILRPTFKTPLVHYMVNCASIGCPNLKATPWRAETLQQDQDAAARAFINSPRGVMIDGARLQVSSIYKWFKIDFGGSEAGVLKHLAQYGDPDLAAALSSRKKVDKYAYDWDVNAPK